MVVLACKNAIRISFDMFDWTTVICAFYDDEVCAQSEKDTNTSAIRDSR